MREGLWVGLCVKGGRDGRGDQGRWKVLGKVRRGKERREREGNGGEEILEEGKERAKVKMKER